MSKITKSASEAKYYNKKIKLKCVVNGKSISPYCVPKLIKIECSPIKGAKCDMCKINDSKEFTVEPVDEHILRFIDAKINFIPGILKQMFDIPCKFTYEVLEMQNMERLFIAPLVGREGSKVNIAPVAYFVGHGIEANTPYLMEGYTTTNPEDQTTTHVFTEAKKLKSDIELFEMSEEMDKRLSKFVPDDKSLNGIFEHLQQLYDSYAHNITKIYGRIDLHMAVDLVFRSCLSFRFDNEFVHKGWMDVMIIGDTRCGKGYVTEKLVKYFGAGEVISGENCTLAGLVAGTQQFNGHWVVTWGKIPMNDGGLVVIDEASEIPPDAWNKLSRIRSEGVAEITKINTQATNARTRTIWLTNPIFKTISDYSFGIESLLEIIKAPEDIARFDYVLVVAHNEVSVKDINKHRGEVEPMYDQDDERDLLLWMWSRKPDEIMFSEAAVAMVYDSAVKMSEKYSFSIPLIQGENVRIKLAKIAAAFAGRLYSNKREGKYLYVDIVHVKCALRFLRLIYDKAVSGYAHLSYDKKQNDPREIDKDYVGLIKMFKAYGKNAQKIASCFLRYNKITLNNFMEFTGIPPDLAKDVISFLLNYGYLKPQGNFYVTNSAFVEYLRKDLDKKKEEGTC